MLLVVLTLEVLTMEVLITGEVAVAKILALLVLTELYFWNSVK